MCVCVCVCVRVCAGRDVCATSPTGTGKTGAYLLPLLAHLLKRPSREGGPRHTAYPAALILAPTRELVAQVGVICAGQYRWTCAYRATGRSCTHARTCGHTPRCRLPAWVRFLAYTCFDVCVCVCVCVCVSPSQINDEVCSFIKDMHLKAVMLHGGDGMMDQVGVHTHTRARARTHTCARALCERASLCICL